jgi:type II secretion system protein G
LGQSAQIFLTWEDSIAYACNLYESFDIKKGGEILTNSTNVHNAKRAFTLIELLIVVAIIAILAAIAVPNFLEAQTRSKVSRCAADMRSIRTAIESYRVDYNRYPETDLGVANLLQQGCGMLRLTTPVAYISSVPTSPFREENIGYPGWPGPANRKLCNIMKTYLWVRAIGIPSLTTPGPGAYAEFDANYMLDRAVYLQLAPLDFEKQAGGFWMLKSVGPNNGDDRDSQQGFVATAARVYDPTNGTVSAGDVVVFGDTQGFAKP